MEEELPGQTSIVDFLEGEMDEGIRRLAVVMPAGGRESLSKEQQVKIHNRLVDKAYGMLIDFVVEREDEIREGALERMEAYYEEYGDSSFQMGEEECAAGALEEADDTLNYIIFGLYARERH